MTVTNKALAVHHTATENSAWDGPKAVASMPNDEATLRYCHAWMDAEGDPDSKSSYKFPHHRTKGGPANLPACRNGLARLEGANIPDADREAVRRHLQAHLNDAREDNSLKHYQAQRARLQNLVAGQSTRAWYEIRNLRAQDEGEGEESGGETEVMLYDQIGYGGVTANDFVRDLGQVASDRITVRMNSEGGEVFDGIAIYNALKRHPAMVTVQVDSLAASIGSVIAMAGDRIVMQPGSSMMIHDASGMAIGDANDMRELADLLDRTSDNIAAIYAERAGGTPQQWRERMRATTWFNADEAVDAGLADETAGSPAKPDQPPRPEPGETPDEHEPERPMPKRERRMQWDPDQFRRALEEAISE